MALTNRLPGRTAPCPWPPARGGLPTGRVRAPGSRVRSGVTLTRCVLDSNDSAPLRRALKDKSNPFWQFTGEDASKSTVFGDPSSFAARETAERDFFAKQITPPARPPPPPPPPAQKARPRNGVKNGFVPDFLRSKKPPEKPQPAEVAQPHLSFQAEPAPPTAKAPSPPASTRGQRPILRMLLEPSFFQSGLLDFLYPKPAAPPPPPRPINGDGAMRAPAPAAPAVNGGGPLELVGSSKWQGEDVRLSNSRQHNERSGQWHHDHLYGAARTLVEGDSGAASWRQKLHVVQQVLNDGNIDNIDSQALATCAVYLYWVSTGAIMCREDGSHYRPNHHAMAAQSIFHVLERISGSRYGAEGESARLALRRLHPHLPSFTAEFTQSVPLTRIRDIAHGKGDRDGRCREERQEIKHTIQNKLHRCAGPEDLIATEKMLAKLTAPGTDYPEEFVNEFKIFYKELKEFFNASSIADRLEALVPHLNDEARRDAESFLHEKRAFDSTQSPSKAQLLTLLSLLSQARGSIVGNIPHIHEVAQQQQARLSEIGLEEYSFVLLSQLANALEKVEVNERGARWSSEVLMATAYASQQLAVSGLRGEESAAISNEASSLAQRMQEGSGNMSELMLQSQAVADRAQRLAEDFCSAIVDLYEGPVSALASGFGIDERLQQLYSESEIRSSVTFQMSRLASLALITLRQQSGAGAFDTLVQGEVVGTLRILENLEAAVDVGEDIVALLLNASGDEEVTNARIKGVILAHDLPHLSHLALRARQQGLPLVACSWADEGALSEVRGMEGRPVRLVASQNDVQVVESADTAVYTQETGHSQVVDHYGDEEYPVAEPSVVDTSCAGQLLREEDVTLELGGAKANACRELSSLAETAPRAAQFYTPRGASLPYGSMEAALQQVQAYEFFEEALSELDSADIDFLEDPCARVRDIVELAGPSAPLVLSLQQYFGRDKALIVRSSANVEDLKGMSGAGLHDSIANVPAGNAAALSGAIKRVWASLFTKRAVASRRSAGVPQGNACMAVWIQELVPAEVSFILMSRNPINGNPDEVYVELAPGLGETLASGATRGSPWRMSIDVATNTVTMLAFASFSSGFTGGEMGRSEGMGSSITDYSQHFLNTDTNARNALGVHLAGIAKFLEQRMGGPQDIEGALDANGNVWIVQARPQP